MGKLLYGLSISIVIIFITLGITCLLVNKMSAPLLLCDIDGSPPLRDWLLGVGFGYTGFGIIFGSFFTLMIICDRCLVNSHPFMESTVIVTIIGFCFVIVWTIIGSISLWINGMKCYYDEPLVWIVSFSTITVSSIETIVFGLLIVPIIATL